MIHQAKQRTGFLKLQVGVEEQNDEPNHCLYGMI